MAKPPSRQPVSTRHRKQWLTILQTAAANKKSGGQIPPNILLDSNVWISAILFGGLPQTALLHSLDHYQVVTSYQTIDEIYDFLRYQTRGPHRWCNQMRQAIELQTLRPDVVDLDSKVIRDPKNTHVVAAAIAGKCMCVITGDDDLLVVSQINDIPIISVAEYIMNISTMD